MRQIIALGILSLFSTATLASLDDRIADQQSAIERYRSIASNGGWKSVGGEGLIRKGASGTAVDQLIARLKATGDLDSDATSFDAKVADAVRRFQTRHGLKVDGVVGPETRTALNVPASERLRILEINLKRIRQRAPDGDSRAAIVVNVPDFKMEYRRPDGDNITMPVIVGKAAWDTPSMTDTLESIVFNPTWNIPVEIVAAELAPKLAENPDYLSENNMVVLSDGFNGSNKVDPSTIDWANVTQSNFEYFVREEPGPENPLGQVKFLFPNSDDIYLHDTPDKHLFDRDHRALSHGCIRLKRPFELANAILGEERVSQAREGGDTQWVTVDPQIPVHLVYWTAWVDSGGLVQFRKDIYDRDADHGES